MQTEKVRRFAGEAWAEIRPRLPRFIGKVLLVLCICLTWGIVGALTLGLGLAYAFAGNRPFHADWVAVAMLGGPVIAVLTTILTVVNKRLRWMWALIGLTGVAVVPPVAAHLSKAAYWPRAKAMPVAATCPIPWGPDIARSAPPTPPAVPGAGIDGMEGGGGIPDGFVAVRAVRCTILHDMTMPVVGGGVANTVLRTEQATGATLTNLISALREPAEVEVSGTGCPTKPGRSVQPWSSYLIVVDAHGAALLAGLPLDRCGNPHADAVKASANLSWQMIAQDPLTYRLADPIPAPAACPRTLTADHELSLPAAAVHVPGMFGGGGIPDGFVPVRAAQCIVEPGTTDDTRVVVARTATGLLGSETADLRSLVSALREPAEVAHTANDCTGLPAIRDLTTTLDYLVLTDAQGTSLLAGLPIDHCGQVQRGASAAYHDLDWQNASEQTVPAP